MLPVPNTLMNRHIKEFKFSVSILSHILRLWWFSSFTYVYKYLGKICSNYNYCR